MEIAFEFSCIDLVEDRLPWRIDEELRPRKAPVVALNKPELACFEAKLRYYECPMLVSVPDPSCELQDVQPIQSPICPHHDPNQPNNPNPTFQSLANNPIRPRSPPYPASDFIPTRRTSTPAVRQRFASSPGARRDLLARYIQLLLPAPGRSRQQQPGLAVGAGIAGAGCGIRGVIGD